MSKEKKVFISQEELNMLNRFRNLTVESLDLIMKLLAGQILHKDAEKITEKIAFEEIDLEKRLKELEDERKSSKENDCQIKL